MNSVHSSVGVSTLRGGLARWMSWRSHGLPYRAILAHCSAVSLIEPWISFWSSGSGGRPPGCLGFVFMGDIVRHENESQKLVDKREFLNHNNSTSLKGLRGVVMDSSSQSAGRRFASRCACVAVRTLLAALLVMASRTVWAQSATFRPSDCRPGNQDNTCVPFIHHGAISAPTCPPGQQQTASPTWMGAYWSQPGCAQIPSAPVTPPPTSHDPQPDFTACANNINAYVLHIYGPSGLPIGANLYLADSSGWFLVSNGVRYPYTSLAGNQTFVGSSSTMIEYLQDGAYYVKAISSFWSRDNSGNWTGGYEIACSFDGSGRMVVGPHTEGYTVFSEGNLLLGSPTATPKSRGTYVLGTGR